MEEAQALNTPLDDLPPYIQDLRQGSDAGTGITAAAAQLLGEEHQQEILHLQSSTDMYSDPTILRIPINQLPTLGLLTRTDDNARTVCVHRCQEGTKLSRLPRWRSMINKHPVIASRRQRSAGKV